MLVSATTQTIAILPAGPTVHFHNSMRCLVATLKNGKSYEIDAAEYGDESLQIDPEMLKQVLAAED